MDCSEEYRQDRSIASPHDLSATLTQTPCRHDSTGIVERGERHSHTFLILWLRLEMRKTQEQKLKTNTKKSGISTAHKFLVQSLDT